MSGAAIAGTAAHNDPAEHVSGLLTLRADIMASQVSTQERQSVDLRRTVMA